jgi:hypothetical protein
MKEDRMDSLCNAYGKNENVVPNYDRKSKENIT